MRANTNPEIQVTSLGFLKPPVKYTLPTWRMINTAAIGLEIIVVHGLILNIEGC